MFNKLRINAWFALTIVGEQGDWMTIVYCVAVCASHPEGGSDRAVTGPDNAWQFMLIMLSAMIAPDRSFVRTLISPAGGNQTLEFAKSLFQSV
ncbi:MAG: hypothetical protein L0Z50_16750 [Verrucomicrobiales bacterium]|nr:hypothetical protein [Verrucomicrobiales bacterium]